MKLWRSMMALPQPVNGCLFAYFLAFGLAFVSIPVMSLAGRGQATAVVPWTMGALGASAVLLGLVLVTDIRGSARAYASMLKDFKPMGVDYSKSVFAKPAFVRVFGGLFALMGVWFVIASTIFASHRSAS